MDSGYLVPGDTLDDDYDVLKKLLPEEVLGVMDQLICFEVRSVLHRTYSNHSDTDCRSGR